MKRILAIAFFCSLTCYLHAQAVDTTVCDILKDPQSFNGKIVRIKGTVSVGFDQFVVKGPECGQHVNAIWLDYPEYTEAKAGPAALLQLQPAHNFSGTIPAVERSPVKLDKDKAFKQFDTLLSTAYKTKGVCLGCMKYEVSATLVGRLDGAVAGIQRDSAGKIVAISGFGNLNAYNARLVLQSVTDVVPREIDYSKAGDATNVQPPIEADSGDSIKAAHEAAKAFGGGNPVGAEIERAAAAFGNPGEDNGVVLGSGVVNEAKKKNEEKGDGKSPDGVIYKCAFDMERLKGSPLRIAIIYLGDLVADIRAPQSPATASIYSLQSRAWQIAALSAVPNMIKTVTLPGGYVLWNSAWAPDDRGKLLKSGLAGYLANEELIDKQARTSNRQPGGEARILESGTNQSRQGKRNTCLRSLLRPLKYPRNCPSFA